MFSFKILTYKSERGLFSIVCESSGSQMHIEGLQNIFSGSEEEEGKKGKE